MVDVVDAPAQARFARRKLARRLALRPGDAAAFAGGVLLPLGIFAALAVAVASSGAPGWEGALLDLAERHGRGSSSRLHSALEAVRALAAAILLGVVILLLARRRGREALFCVLAAGGVLALDVPLKELFRRPSWSPPGYENNSEYTFPSGHAMGSVAFLAAVSLISSPRWSKPMLVVGLPLVVAVGAVLVYARWHYPSDIVAGWCFALAWVTALWLAIRPRPGAVQ